jgi:hypothetical protein
LRTWWSIYLPLAPCIAIFFLAQRHVVGGISFTGSR